MIRIEDWGRQQIAEKNKKQNDKPWNHKEKGHSFRKFPFHLWKKQGAITGCFELLKSGFAR